MNSIKICLIPILFFLFSICNAQQIVTQEEFKNIANSFGLSFEMPEGYKEIKIIKNPDLDYSFAMISNDGKIEVRYSIFSMKDEPKKNSDKDIISVSINPNTMTEPLIIATVSNLSNGNVSKIYPFPETAVKKEFKADYGSATMFKLDSEYGKGYKSAQLITIHKENVADAFIVLLTNHTTSNDFYEASLIPFHALTFK